MSRVDARAAPIAGKRDGGRARHEPRFAAIYQKRYARFRERLTDHRKTAGHRRNRDDIPADLIADHLGSIADGWTVLLPIEADRFTPERLDTPTAAVVQLLPRHRRDGAADRAKIRIGQTIIRAAFHFARRDPGRCRQSGVHHDGYTSVFCQPRHAGSRK
jgi:hypothetical protein